MFSDTWVYYRIRTTIKNAELLEDKELKGKQCKRPFNLIRGLLHLIRVTRFEELEQKGR